MECQNAQKSSPGVVKKRPSGFKDIVKKTEVKAETEEMQTQTFTAIKKSELKVETDADVFQVDILNAAAAEDDLSYEGKNEYMNEDEIESNCDGEGISITDSVDEFEDESDDTDQAPLKKRKLNSASQGKKSIKKTNCDESRDGDYKDPTNETFASNSNDIKAKVLSGEYKLISKVGRSKVWNVFRSVETDGGVEIPGFLVCSKCTNIYKYNKLTTSNLVRHRCYMQAERENISVTPKVTADNATKKNVVDIITKWVVVNCRPFKIVTDSGLKEIANFFVSVGAKFGTNIDIATFIPDPTTISRNVELMYGNKLNEIKSEISAIVDIGYGLTSYLWTDNHLRKSYLALTIHYLMGGKIYSRLLGMKSMDNERNTSQNVHAKIVKLLSDFGCVLDSKAIMVTDRGSNMVSAFRPYNHLFCINHLLQNTLKKSMDEVKQIFDMCSTGSKLVRYFKKSGNNSNFSTSLKSFSPTRWNTFYYLFQSIKDNWNEITQILQEKNELFRLGDLSVSHISCLIEVLQLFEEALKKLEGENYPTLHLVIVYIDKLSRTCAINDCDLSLIRLFKEKILFYLKNLVLENLNIFHKVALFLFPPANQLLQFNDEEKIAIKKVTIEIMSEFSANNQLSTTTALSQSNSELFGRFVSHPNRTNSTETVVEELTMYENTVVHFYDHFDALKWWETNKNQFPLLYKASLRILAIPASSASSERVFSAARSLLTDKRCALGGNTDTVSQIMFLNYNS